jgi:hypothetical protein
VAANSKILLKKALNVFDPQKHLRGRELDRYFVERPYAPLERMKTYLENTQQHVKVLFSGHRGSGKSTELARMAKDLGKSFLIVEASARSRNISDLNYVDIILASATALFNAISNSAKPVIIPDKLLSDVHEWIQSEITKEIVIQTSKSQSIGG